VTSKPPTPDLASVAVLTHRYDAARTGANLAETQLTPRSVSPKTFGLVYSRAVLGQIYAQPLFVPALDIAGGKHDVVIVATEHDDVYAFEADDPLAVDPLWHVSLGTPMPSSDLDADLGKPYPDLAPETGITSTPVIDLESKTMWLVAKTKEGTEYHNRIHALSIVDGSERTPAVDITVPRQIVRHTLQRPALGLSNANGKPVLWIAGGGHGDLGAYTGFVGAWDPKTLAMLGMYRTTPTGKLGGIWQSGNGLPVGDDGEVYFLTGNGTFDDTLDPPELGDTIGRVSFDGANVKLDDWFTPSNQAELDTNDLDLGSSGAVTIPGTKLLMAGGKEGKIYVLKRSALGHLIPNDTQIVQSLQATPSGDHIHGAPVWWKPDSGARIYVWGEYDVMRAYRFDGNTFETTPFMTGTVHVPNGMPGGIMTLSANGGTDGIVWAMHNAVDNSDGEAIVPGIVHAFDASDVTKELWNSNMDARDAVGLYGKFVPPMVADGKLFVATFSGALRVYGLR
jgi:outer membrane protein assembly factor BamB